MKPFYSREGANVAVVRGGQTIAQTDGDYADGPRIFQEYHTLWTEDGRHAVVGSWIVNGYACGLGVREDEGPVTRNTSRFHPHLFRSHRYAKLPVVGSKS